jgi:eukaryotic-like serine/threonine-protein kinase
MSGVPDRARVEDVFEAALDVAAAERTAFVARACGSDADMREAVMALLKAHARAEGVLEGDARGIFEEDRAPERLGPYRVLREIGRGGMGIVYDAERDDGQFRRRVAIKIIRAGTDPELQRRVLAERQILAALQHPHIAVLLDGGVAADGRPYLVMEYVDGLPIDVYCERLRLTVAERLRLFVTVARAVEFAHRNLIVHRDLKPSNVLVTPSGAVKLLDFGVAKLLNPSLGGDAAPATRERSAWTPEYASPEQMQGTALTTTSDVYSLGVMLYELLCGRRPFAHLEHDMSAFVSAVCGGDAERPSTRVLRGEELADEDARRTLVPDDVAKARATTPQRLARRLRGDCDAIVAAALRSEPQRRYGSAELLAQDIERHLAEQPVLAHRGSRSYALWKLIRRHRTQAAALLVAGVAVLAGAGVGGWKAAEAHRQWLRAEAALAQSREVTEFLLDLFESGDPVAQGGSVTARDLVRRGAARIDDLADQPLLQARMLGVLGRIHESLGQYDEARRLTRRALTILGAPELPRDAEAAELLLQYGALQRRHAEYDSAEASFQRARRILESAPGGPHAGYAFALQQLASIAIYRGDLVAAEQRAAEAVDVLAQQHGENSRVTVTALRYLGAVQWRRGVYDEAERNMRRAIQLRPLATGSTRAEALNDRMQLAQLLYTVRRYEDAERMFRDVQRELRDNLPEDVNFRIWAVGSLSNIAEERGDVAEAARLRRDVLALRESTLGADHPDAAYARSHLASTLGRLQQDEEAERLLAAAGAVLLEAYGEDSNGYALYMTDAARLRIAQRRWQDAASLLERAIDLHRSRGWPSGGPFVERLMLLADVEVASGRFERAETVLREALAGAESNLAPSAMLIRQVHEAFDRLYSAWGRPADAARHRALARASSS